MDGVKQVAVYVSQPLIRTGRDCALRAPCATQCRTYRHRKCQVFLVAAGTHAGPLFFVDCAVALFLASQYFGRASANVSVRLLGSQCFRPVCGLPLNADGQSGRKSAHADLQCAVAI